MNYSPILKKIGLVFALAVGSVIILSIAYFLISYSPYVKHRQLKQAQARFPYPTNFIVTEEKFERGSYCLDVCPSLTIYGIFNKPVMNRDAFLLLANQAKKANYTGVNTDVPYYQLSFYAYEPKGSGLVNIQVWPEPKVIPGAGDHPADLPPQVPTQWVKMVFE